MHGFMFFLGPEWYGFGAAESRQHKLVDVWRGQRKKRQPAPDEQEFEFLVVVTLAIALVINIALTVHFVC